MPIDAEFSDYEPVTRRSEQTGRPSEEWKSPKKTQTVAALAPKPSNSFLRAALVGKATPRKEIFPRGHRLTYLSLFLFTAVLYFRPYELIPALSGLTSLALWLGILTLAIFIPSQLAVAGNLTERRREIDLVLLLCVLALLSIPLALNPGEAWGTFNDTFIRAVLIFIVIVNVVTTEGRLRGLLFLALGVACFLSIGAISDYRAGNLALQGRRIQGVIGGMFGNPNDLAIHLVTMFPLAIGLLLGSRSVLIKIIWGLCALLFVIATVATFSRGAFLALVGAGLILTWKLGRRQRFISMSLAGVMGVIFVILAPGDYVTRILSIFGLRPDPLGSAAARENLLTHSIYTAIRHPLGIGMGNYHIVAAHEAVSHNSYTQVASELGILGLVVYVLFMVLPLLRLQKIERDVFEQIEAGSSDRVAKRYYYLAIGLQASLVAYMISSFFGSVAYQWYVYYLVGYAVCLHRLYAATLAVSQTLPVSSLSQPGSLKTADI